MASYPTTKIIQKRLPVLFISIISFIEKLDVSLSVISYIDVNSLRYLPFNVALKVIVDRDS